MSQNNKKLSLLAQPVQMTGKDSSVRNIGFQWLLPLALQVRIIKNNFKRFFEKHIEFYHQNLKQITSLISTIDYIKGPYWSATDIILKEINR